MYKWWIECLNWFGFQIEAHKSKHVLFIIISEEVVVSQKKQTIDYICINFWSTCNQLCIRASGNIKKKEHEKNQTLFHKSPSFSRDRASKRVVNKSRFHSMSYFVESGCCTIANSALWFLQPHQIPMYVALFTAPIFD